MSETQPTQHNGTPRPRTLHRARQERLLFGVCGGLAAYFDVDPTIVRVAVVLAGLIPPIGGTLVLAYALLVFIVPIEGTADVDGRDQVRDNLSELRGEVAGLAETVRERITGEPRDTASTRTAASAPAAAPTSIRDDATQPNETRAA